MASLLQTIVEKKHYRFINEEVTWQEAVRLSAESLVADGSVEPDYYKQIVSCIEQFGPYVVFDHMVAMPHSQMDAKEVHKTGIGFMVSKKTVDFGVDEDGEKKEAKLFFTIAAKNPEEHLSNISQLMGIFSNEPLLDALMEAETPEDILEAEKKFPVTEEF